MTALDALTNDGLLAHAECCQIALEPIRSLKPPDDPRMMRLALGFTSQHLQITTQQSDVVTVIQGS